MALDQIMKRVTKGEIESRHTYTDAKISGCVYTPDQSHWDFVSDVMRRYIVTNPLHAEEYKMVTQFEAEVIRMCCNMYKGDNKTCGLISSGGTESIILAVLAYKEIAKERGVTEPNMVMSNTAHAAFDKAAFYFGVELRKVPITKDYRCDFKALKAQVDSNTIMLVCSAPEYPYGNYDPCP